MGIKPAELKYRILIEKNEEGGYTVTVPSLPGCITQGDRWEEAGKYSVDVGIYPLIS
jgi:hypothetical protein